LADRFSFDPKDLGIKAFSLYKTAKATCLGNLSQFFLNYTVKLKAITQLHAQIFC
jgi:hypothetical protein